MLTRPEWVTSTICGKGNAICGPFNGHGLTAIPAWISNYIIIKHGLKLLIHSQTSTVQLRSLGIDKWFNCIHYWAHNYPFMLGLKLIHVSKRDPGLLGTNPLFNSLRPSDAYMSVNFWSLLQIMVYRHKVIIWTNAGILLIWPSWTNFSEILIKIHIFSFKKTHLTMPAKCRLFCLDLHVLTNVTVLSIGPVE